ncbi:protoporphyrinogen oxidase [Streptomyces sp. A73]|uniref:protoporphyrinogen oxidase n=1 Tax=Streptomyces sp. RK75 TaxID=2824895 RepID=UPI000C1A192C|nr:protoporphyrinogen oxidase [Streptomyces sp. RK75]MBQ0864105.1 protoporphyrinogen oxidase [Streptomyces sp. RK75]MBQ1158455.1 protoporphyrinogen oxidase [Streptomyces sp. A73]
MHVLVIGGGISGLAAAHQLLASGVRVTLLEATDRLGGKLRAGSIAGTAAVDLGAESMLARRPEAVELARAVGLGEQLQPPSVAGGAIWTRGAVRPMPKGHLMGVPGDPAALGGVLSPEGLARIAEDGRLPRTEVGEDVAVGDYVARRLGREVVDRLVEPLLGGVYAGDAYRISMRAAVPQLYEAARGERSLLAAVRAVQERAATSPAPPGPVFMGLEGGVGRLPGAVAEACTAKGADIRLNTPVTRLGRVPSEAGSGWIAETPHETVRADAVVLAAPAPAAARLLAPHAPVAAAELDTVEYASMALVTLAFRRSEADRVPDGSGFLVPPVDGRAIKAATFSAHKWSWVAAQDPSLFVLRTSLGRYGEESTLQRDDAELVELSLRDLRAATGLRARPVDTLVSRWDGGLPQYPVGHLERVAAIRAAVDALPGLAVAGAVYEGVGIPACVASGRRAARHVLQPAHVPEPAESANENGEKTRHE